MIRARTKSSSNLITGLILCPGKTPRERKRKNVFPPGVMIRAKEQLLLPRNHYRRSGDCVCVYVREKNWDLGAVRTGSVRLGDMAM